MESDHGITSRRPRVRGATLVVALFVAAGLGSASCKRRGAAPPAGDGGVPTGWFAFTPPPDPFAPSAIDLRALNEARAGDGGFIVARGDGFVHQKTGEPVRFWAVNTGPPTLDFDAAGRAHYARFLAKLGVNMVRFHGPLWRDDDVARIDAAKLDKLHALAAALEGEGIYLALSTYFPYWLRPKDGPVFGRSVFEGYDGTKPPYGLPFWGRPFQEMQKGWWRQILTPRNPYTGLPLGQDPGLAFFEMINEDSLFFWTFAPYDSVPAPQMKIVEGLFGDWLQKRYGALGATFTRWGGKRVAGDDAGGGRAGVMPLAEMLRRRDARAQDTAAFLTALERGYFDEMYRFLKGDLAFKGSVTGSNWITADARTLGPLDKWANAGCDFMDRHGYFTAPHEGEKASYLISNGDRYDDALALRFETGKPGAPSFELPIMDLAYNGKPSTVSELSWLPPNRYRTDMSLLAAAYGALQGTDAFVFFSSRGETGWVREIEKFTIADPVMAGQFPAAALIFRKGLVRTAGVVAQLGTDLSKLTAFAGLPIAAPHNLDALRAVAPGGTAAPDTAPRAVDRLAFLVGRVEATVGETAAPASTTTELGALVDHDARIARSATGELAWDWGRGVARIDAPAAQGAVGLLQAAGPIALRDVTIVSGNDYGAVVLVALDGVPLSRSKRMLLQVMTEDSNSGWFAPGRGLRTIESVGGPPLVVKRIAGTITFKRQDALSVRPLDWSGYETGRREVVAGGQLTLLPSTFYYLITLNEGGS